MSLSSANLWQVEEIIEIDDDDAACKKCGSTDADQDDMLLCDTCGADGAYHLKCLSPPLEEVPQGDWHCPSCTRNRAKKNIAAPESGLHARLFNSWYDMLLSLHAKNLFELSSFGKNGSKLVHFDFCTEYALNLLLRKLVQPVFQGTSPSYSLNQ